MIEKETINHEYLPVLGLDSFSSAATAMLLGTGNPSQSGLRLIYMAAFFSTVDKASCSQAVGYKREPQSMIKNLYR
jgi:hypothetical protein